MIANNVISGNFVWKKINFVDLFERILTQPIGLIMEEVLS